jgi:hypothetical protein
VINDLGIALNGEGGGDRQAADVVVKEILSKGEQLAVIFTVFVYIFIHFNFSIRRKGYSRLQLSGGRR